MRRNLAWIATCSLLSLSPLPVFAQPAQPDILPSRPLTVDFGVRGTDLSGDAARFQRYRDLRDGLFLRNLRLAREGGNWLASLQTDDLARRDQRYRGHVRYAGRLKVSVGWDQIPLFISRDTRTLYETVAPGALRVDDAIQQGIQAETFSIADVIDRAVRFDTGSRRHTGDVSVTYSPSRDVDVGLRVASASREGNMPWGATFGHNNAIEVPVPIDTRTTDLGVHLEWANQGGMLRLGYEASWFENDIQVLVWDNPLKFTDSTYPTAFVDGRGVSQGRYALWPNSTRHTVTSSGSIRLPARSRATGTVAIGSLNQNESVVPFTINTAIPEIPLPRGTAQAEARTLASTLAFTSRPSRLLSLNARYRYYGFDNRTPPFPVTTYVRADQAAVPLPAGGSTPYGVTRQEFEADAAFRPLPFTGLRVGYGRHHADRTFRVFEATVEDTVRLSVDTVGHALITARLLFEHAARRGRNLDLHVLEVVGEQPGMRHYDIATRDRTRLTAQMNLTPLSILGVTASAGAGRDDYAESPFGLRDNTHQVYSAGFDLAPAARVALGLWYSLERYDTLQFSRQAAPGPEFVDPARNWSTDSNDRVHTMSAWMDLLAIVPRTDVRLWYDLSTARARYIYDVGTATDRTLPPGSPLPATLPVPQQLADVTSAFHRGAVDGRYFLTDQFGVRLSYGYDRFRVQDFALGPERISRLDLPGGILLGYLYRPYRAHSASLSVFYFW